MNEIAGIYHLDGAPVAPDQIKHMLDAVASWPADRVGIRHEAVLGLGARQFFTTQEDTFDSLPRQSGQYLITTDARIDNRRQLIRELSIALDDTDSSITDSYLILKAYERWGEDCPDRLIGDFAFAIWDGDKQCLFCARDAMGVRPFYYCHAPGKRFAFGTTIGMVLQGGNGVDTGLNELKLGLMMALDYSDREITIRKNILRLPGGHCLSVGGGRFDIRRYWRLEAVPDIRLASDDEYAAAMREVFFESVRNRLRSIYPIGAQLSGGLDSSSVVCTSSRLLTAESPGGQKLLHAFSAIFPQAAELSKSIDERTYQRAVVDSCPNVTHHSLVCDGLDPFVPDLWQGDQPIAFYNYYLDNAMFAAARDLSVRAVLTGHDGDAAVSHGYELLTGLAARLRWIELFRQSFMLARKRWKRSIKVAWHLGFKPYWTLIGKGWRHRQYDQAEFERANPIINREFARRIGLGEARKAMLKVSEYWDLISPRINFLNSVTHGIYAYLLEDLDWLARAHRIEVRHPFFDRRFLEFSLAIPPEQKLKCGVTRYVMHQAMRGILPDSVYHRTDKSNLSVAIRQSLRRQCSLLQSELMEGKPDAFDFLNSSHCQAVSNHVNSTHDYVNRDGMDLFLAVLVRRWLLTQNTL